MGARHDLHSSRAEINRRAATVRAHVDAYGWVCPGWDCAAHVATDLTADHVIPVGMGGDPAGPLRVLCRTCNGRKGNRTSSAVNVPSVRSRDWLT